MKKSRYFSIVLVVLGLFMWVTAVSASTHHIKSGETLSGIAAQYGVSIAVILQANPKIIDPDLIYAGDFLEIPEPGPTGGVAEGGIYIVQPGDWLHKIARQQGTTIGVLAALNPQIANLNRIYPGDKIVLPEEIAAQPESLPQPPVTTNFGVGAEVNNFNNVVTVLDMEMTWVKMEFRWTPGDSPGLVAGDIQRAHDYGLKILLSIIGKDEHPLPGTIEFSRYVDFVKGVAELGPDAIEIWNEMNLDKEWPQGEIDPKSYVNDMLKPAYAAIKSVDHDIVVIAGGLAPTGYYPSAAVMDDGVYLNGLVEAEAARYMDCMGVHYKSGATSPYLNAGHPAATDHHSWYFKRTMDRYRDAWGGLRPLCLTEIGYLSPEGMGGLPGKPSLPGEFSWAADTALTEQALWLAEAIVIAENQYNVGMLIVNNLDFTTMGNTEPQAGYAIMRQDGTCPACTPIKNAIHP